MTTGDKKKFTKKIYEIGGKEGGNGDSRNADNCNLLRVVKLLVVEKGVGKKGVVVCFEFADNRNGLVCLELKLCRIVVVL